MSQNRRFLGDSPHRPLMSEHKDNYHTWPTIMCAFIIILILIFLTLIYHLIRRRPPSATLSQPQSGSCSDQLEALPVTVYGDDEEKTWEETERVCAVCLGEYERGERLRRMPCDHLFHCVCIDPWLRESGLCPVCRRVVVDKELISVENERQRCDARLMAANNFPTRMNMAQLM